MDFSRFLAYYNPYVNSEWRPHYFAYDTLRQRYKAIKEHKGNETSRERSLKAFEQEFLREIERVHNFVAEIAKDIDVDLAILLNAIDTNNAIANTGADKKALKSQRKLGQNDRTIELSLRSLYDKSKDIELFYHLNYYSISKISKKLEKLLQHYGVVVDAQSAAEQRLAMHAGQGEAEDICKKFPPVAVAGVGVLSMQAMLAGKKSFTPSPRQSKTVTDLSPISSSVNSSEASTVHQTQSSADGNEDFARAAHPAALSTTPTFENRKQRLAVKIKPVSDQQRGIHVSKPSRDLTVMDLEDDLHMQSLMRETISSEGEEKVLPEIDTLSRESSRSTNHSQSSLPAVQTTMTWELTPSGQFFYSTFQPMLGDIEGLKRRCVDIYSKKFRVTHSQLASYELEFVKNKDKHYDSTNFLLGLKVGLILCLVLLLVLDTKTIHNDFEFWLSPGLYVYTTVGNLLLYRVCWWVNIAIWAKHDVSYLPILQLNDVKPNLLLVADQTASLLALFFIDLLLFFRSNSSYSSLGHTFLSFVSPVVLVGVALLYQVFEYAVLYDNERVSRGLFNVQVLRNCVSAPFVRVSFRDVYSADVLTSFTRIIADALHAACWMFSGSLLDASQTESAQCSSHAMLVGVSYVTMIPLLIRLLQCCRAVRDARFSLYPQGWNALKYALSLLVVVSALGYPVLSDEYFSLCLVVVTALYKWYWDVVMDWGLFEILPQSVSEFALFFVPQWLAGRLWGETSGKVGPAESAVAAQERRQNMFLRRSLMYPSVWVYYVCIVLDLALRFLWVLSLVPESYFGSFVGYQMKLFVGSMEILRRCMWGALRVEHEHLKMLKNKTPGFLQNRVLRRNLIVPRDSD